ncbi:hypothetical protein ACIQ7D_10415 [Streptomyces sp. NPDC096310]|uniref:hypothetical protein n=1 Tax=Streptomyces sp. NPDC096310 TaxID=3366082 RepID=UPI003826B9E0
MDVGRETGTPWWYRIPSFAVALISLSAVAMVVYSVFSGADNVRLGVALGSGLTVGLAASFVQGIAQKRYDEKH